MPILTSKYVLVSKKRLTSDVFELVFDTPEKIPSKAGEYVLFDLAPGIKRAYSIAHRSQSGAFAFIIKRVE